MSQFDEASRRHEDALARADAQRRRAEAAKSQQALRQVPAADRVAGIVRQSLTDMARHLSAKGASTYKHTWKKTDGWFAPKLSSPRGFVLTFDANSGFHRFETGHITSLQLLTQEGRLWNFSNMGRYLGGIRPEGEYQEVTGEAIVANRVGVGKAGLRINDAGEPELHTSIPFSGGDFVVAPYFEGPAHLTHEVLTRKPLF